MWLIGYELICWRKEWGHGKGTSILLASSVCTVVQSICHSLFQMHKIDKKGKLQLVEIELQCSFQHNIQQSTPLPVLIPPPSAPHPADRC